MLRKQARNKCNAILKQQQFLHEQKLRRKVLDYSKGSKNFWSFVKTVKNAETSSIPHLIKDEKANILSEIFSKNSSLSTTPFHATGLMSEVHIRTREVKKVLLKLDIKKSSGPDGIPARVLNICSSSLAKPLCNLFYISFKLGKFPSRWKIVNVQAVTKKGDPSGHGNYRPISICSNLAKVKESILNHKLMKYLIINTVSGKIVPPVT